MERTRLIAVGVADADQDQAALEWARDEARPGIDSVHVVHAYQPIRLDGSGWPPVVAARGARRSRAERVVAVAEQRLRAVVPALAVDGSVVAGATWDVLREFSSIVDLIVIGEDDPGTDCATTASRVVRLARCPVVTVPVDWRPAGGHRSGPVTVLLDSGQPARSLIHYGLAEAQQRKADLRVVQSTELRSGDIVECCRVWLHEQVATWCGQFPDVAVITQMTPAEDVDAVTALRQSSRLLVAAAGTPDMFTRTATMARGRCPLVTIPL